MEFVTLHRFVEGADSWRVLLESTKLEDLQVRVEAKPGPRRFPRPWCPPWLLYTLKTL